MCAEKSCMNVLQITKSVFHLMIALVKLVQYQIQTKIKKKGMNNCETGVQKTCRYGTSGHGLAGMVVLG